MSNIVENLQKILSSVYGKDVRQAIHDAIHDCYEDGKVGAIDLIARENIQTSNHVLNNRIDTILGQTGSTSELVDARVSFDGYAYSSAGSAIRDQISNLHDGLNKMYDFQIGTNLFNNKTTSIGAIQSDGTISTSSAYGDYITSEYIELSPNTDYTISYAKSDGTVIIDRIIFILFDANKNAISNTYVNDKTVGYYTFNSGSAKYLRISLYNNNGSSYDIDHRGINNGQVEIGTEYSYYKHYIEKTIVNTHDDTKLDIEEYNKSFNVVMGKNLANPNTEEIGFLMPDGTIPTNGAYANYKTSDFIKVEGGTTYTVSRWYDSNLQKNRIIYLLYDEEKNILNEYLNDTTSSEHQVTPTIDGFIRLSYFVSSSHNHIQFEVSDVATEFEPYSKKIYSTFDIDPSVFPKTDILSNKKWVACGDSFTDYTNAQFNDGQFNGKDKTYPRLIAERTGMILNQTFFASGRTLAYPADGSFQNSLTSPSSPWYYRNIPEDTDYITIMLGINDAHHENGISSVDYEDVTGVIPLGTITDNTTATYYGAWNVVLTWLLEHRPFAHIGIIVTNGCDREAYRTAQIEIAKKYGIPFIDLNGDDRTPVMIRSQNPNIPTSVKEIIKRKQAVDISSNTHPNYLAHKYESTFIENFLRSI